MLSVIDAAYQKWCDAAYQSMLSVFLHGHTIHHNIDDQGILGDMLITLRGSQRPMAFQNGALSAASDVLLLGFVNTMRMLPP